MGYGSGLPNYAFRLVWADGLPTLQMAIIIMKLLRKPNTSAARWRLVAIVGLTVQGTITASRAVLAWYYPADFGSFLTPHPVNVAFAFAGPCTAILMIGMLMACSEDTAYTHECLAIIDGLTGVLNRHAWLTLANEKLANAVPHDPPLGVLLIDIDNFKQINDTYRYETGDRTLRMFAKLMQEVRFPAELVCRYGSTQFCVLIEETQKNLLNFDERMRVALANTMYEANGCQLTYSAGRVMRTSADRKIPELLLLAAQALHHAKATGKNRTVDAFDF